MPTIFTHSIVGLLSAKIVSSKKVPLKFWILSALCSIIPDFDVIAFKLGIPYHSFWGHRGFFHSITFALIIALIVTFVFFKNTKPLFRKWHFTTLYFWIITASHGIFDGMTKSSHGVAFFSPFYNERFNLPFTPMVISPIDIDGLLSEWGLNVVISELKWIILPLLTITIIIILIRKFNKTNY